MNKIVIDPHYCDEAEYQELLDYLNENCWDYREEVEHYQKIKRQSINGM